MSPNSFFPDSIFFLILTVREKSVNIFPVPVIKSCWLNATLSGYSVNMHHVTISATLSIASFIGYCKFAQDTGSKFHSCQHSSIVLLETNTNSVLSQLHPQKCQKGGRQSRVNYEQFITDIILLQEKFLQFDWLRAVVFQLNFKYLHVKITNLLWVVV